MLDRRIWSPRLKKEKLRHLYEQSAMGISDSELLREVALTLYLRCKDILAVRDARDFGQVRCPYCWLQGREHFLPLAQLPFHARETQKLTCGLCGGSFTFGEFRQSYREQQLNPGGAIPAFERFVAQYEKQPEEGRLLIEVDRLIHEFHFHQLKNMAVPGPTRSTGPNLIEGRLQDIVAFLDELSAGQQDREMLERYREWKERLGEQGKDR